MTTNSSASNFASCHSDAAGPLAASGAPVVALVGAPNVGKSTLFNSLTGARRQVGNWPGTTVEVGRARWSVPLRERTAVPDLAGAGSWDEPGSEVALLDLPGAYSLDAISPDEQFTRTLLMPPDEADRPDLIVVVADASRLARSLYLVSQVRESEGRVVVALTMSDVAARREIEVDVEELHRRLGAPVVRVDPRHGIGDADLARAVAQSLGRPPLPARPRPDLAGDELASADERFAWIQDAIDAATVSPQAEPRTWSDRIDRWVTAPWLGPIIFLAVMWVVFQLTTTAAAPCRTGSTRCSPAR